jgi:transposase
MWRSYREAHKAWRREVAVARRDGDRKWLRKLLRRQPSEPFMNGMQGKVPIWVDSRIGSIEKSKHLKLCPYVARVSTLRRGVKLTIPLNPAKYHLDILARGAVKSFQLVKRYEKYYVHVKVEYEVPTQPVYAARGIDLGVKRSIASVMLRPNQPLRSSDFTIETDGLKKNRLNRLEKRIAELQQARKWEPLKRIRHKRLHVSEYYDRLAAKQIAATSQNCLVVVGYPKGIKYENFKGNGKARLRRTLAHWTYGREIHYIQEECAKVGVPTETPDERWSSRTCHRCGSRHTERITQSIFHCWNCELIYNADYNAAINIGSRFLPKATTRQATDDLAYAQNEQAREIVACKPRSPHPFMGGS